MFGKSVTLFRLFGFDVRVDASWLILAFLLTWSLARGVFPYWYKDFSTSTYWWMAIAGTIGLFLSIVFHELSHSLIARQNGIPMKGITLFIFGGVAHMDQEPPDARSELYMAIAGPIASIVLGSAFLGVQALGNQAGWPAPSNALFGYLGWINLVLAGFNLVPAFPLDGGRVLRSILWGWKKNLKQATRIAASIGSGFGSLLVALGILAFFFGNLIAGIWWVMIGLFLRGASAMSEKQLAIRQALTGEPVDRFMKDSPVTVSPGVSVRSLVEDYIYQHHFKMFPVVDGGNLVGCVTTRNVKTIPKSEWGQREVREIMSACDAHNTIEAGSDAMDALAVMNRENVSRLMVVRNGSLAGVLALKDLARFLSLKLDLEQDENIGTAFGDSRG